MTQIESAGFLRGGRLTWVDFQARTEGTRPKANRNPAAKANRRRNRAARKMRRQNRKG